MKTRHHYRHEYRFHEEHRVVEKMQVELKETRSHAVMVPSRERDQRDMQEKIPSETKPPGTFEKVKSYIKQMKSEPIMAFYTLCMSVSQPFIQNVIIDKLCVESYPTEDCYSHTNETIEAQVQSVAAQYLMSLYLLRLVPAIIISVFIGHWSDIHGRKQVLVVALCGNVLSYVLYLVNVIKISLHPKYMVLAAIPSGLTGDYTIMMFGMYSILRDTSTLEELAVKIAIIDGVEQIGNEVGPIIGSQLYKALDYPGVFSCSIVLLLMGVAFALLRIKEPQFKATTWKTSILDLFHIKGFVKNVMVLVKKRSGNRRLYIIANMFCAIVYFMCYIGYEEIIYMYGRLVVKWDVVMYSYFTALVGGLQAIGFLIILPLVVKWFHVSDIGLVLIGITSGMLWFTVTAFVTSKLEIFLVRCIGILICFVSVSLRSITLKCVKDSEIGKITGMYSIAQTLGQILGRVVSTQIYVASLNEFPGAFFIFCAGISCMILIIFGTMLVDVRKRKDVDI